MSWRGHHGGFSLVEVMVALLIMAIAMLGIVRALAAAVAVLGAADDHRRGLEAIGAVAQTAAPGIAYPIGRRPVSTPGPDGLPGTADDPPTLQSGCERQIDSIPGLAVDWLWVRAWCGAALARDEAESLASARLLVAR